jgi:hypothetical protein
MGLHCPGPADEFPVPGFPDRQIWRQTADGDWVCDCSVARFKAAPARSSGRRMVLNGLAQDPIENLLVGRFHIA